MSQSNVEVVQRLFDLFAEGGIEPALVVIDPSVVIEIPPDMSAEPDSYHGHPGVRRYFEGFDGMIDDIRYEALELTPVGTSCSRTSVSPAAGRAAGSTWPSSRTSCTSCPGGRIVRIAPVPDLESARAALS